MTNLQKILNEQDAEFETIFDSYSIEEKDGETLTTFGASPQQIKDYLHKRDTAIISAVIEWAESTAGATGIDLRGRRWIDLQDLKSSLEGSV